MIEFNNCKFADLDKLEIDDINFYITTGLLITPNSFGVEPLREMKYGKVMELLMLFNKEINLPEMDYICEFVMGKKVKQRYWHEVFAFYNWIQNEVKDIEEILKTLYIAPSGEEEAAGIDTFSEFGVFTTIDRLAGGDPLKYDAIEALPFNMIYTKLKLNKVTYEYEDRLRKIYSAKHH